MTTESEVLTAAGRLGAFILRHTREIELVLNIQHRPCEMTGPSTYEALFKRAKRVLADAGSVGAVSRPFFDVDEANSLWTVYPRRDMNYACRFWHDLMHVQHGLLFELKDEMKLGQMQVGTIEREFGAHSLEARIMEADTCGQSLYDSIHGKFPTKQKTFVIDYIVSGASVALMRSYE